MNVFSQLIVKSTLTSFLVLSSFLSTCDLEAVRKRKLEVPTQENSEENKGTTHKRARKDFWESLDQGLAQDNAGSISVLPPEILSSILQNNFGIKDLATISLASKYFGICAQDGMNIQKAAHLKIARELAGDDDTVFKALRRKPQNTLSNIHTIVSYFELEKSNLLSELIKGSSEQIEMISQLAPFISFYSFGQSIDVKMIGSSLNTEDKKTLNFEDLNVYGTRCSNSLTPGLEFMSKEEKKYSPEDYAKKAVDFFETILKVKGSNPGKRDYEHAADAHNEAALYSSIKEDQLNHYQRVAELSELSFEGVEARFIEDYSQIPISYFNAAGVASSPEEQFKYYKKAVESGEKFFESLGGSQAAASNLPPITRFAILNSEERSKLWDRATFFTRGFYSSSYEGWIQLNEIVINSYFSMARISPNHEEKLKHFTRAAELGEKMLNSLGNQAKSQHYKTVANPHFGIASHSPNEADKLKYFKKAVEFREKVLGFDDYQKTNEDYKFAATTYLHAAKFSPNVEEKLEYSQRAAGLYEESFTLFPDKVAAQDCNEAAEAYANMAQYSSDREEKCSKLMRSADLYINCLRLLGDQVTAQNYRDAARAYLFLSQYSSSIGEKYDNYCTAANFYNKLFTVFGNETIAEDYENARINFNDIPNNFEPETTITSFRDSEEINL